MAIEQIRQKIEKDTEKAIGPKVRKSVLHLSFEFWFSCYVNCIVKLLDTPGLKSPNF